MESVCVETRIALHDEEDLINKTVKFSLVLFWNAELVFFKETCIPMGCNKVFIILMKVSSCLGDII